MMVLTLREAVIFRIEVNQNVKHFGMRIEDPLPGLLANIVAFGDGNGAIHFDMHIDIDAMRHAPRT